MMPPGRICGSEFFDHHRPHCRFGFTRCLVGRVRIWAASPPLAFTVTLTGMLIGWTGLSWRSCEASQFCRHQPSPEASAGREPLLIASRSALSRAFARAFTTNSPSDSMAGNAVAGRGTSTADMTTTGEVLHHAAAAEPE